jgi:extracellular factor (EF) 3-hydroxypalmitic acid methyl ester biosynthesis protein
LVLGPDESRWHRDEYVGSAAPAEILSEVRGAATQLVAEIDHAKTQTDEWQNEDLGFALIDVALSRCLSRLAATGCRGRDNQLPSSELWRIAGPVLDVGSLQQRARFKPRGYAGDYLLLAQLCDHYLCADPLGRLFDRFFQSQAAVHVVRTRTEQIAAALADFVLLSDRARVRVCSVGSGPAIDIARGVGLVPDARRRQLEVELLDMDDEALDYAGARLRSVMNAEQIACRRDNLYRLADKPRPALASESCDFLVCSGLFDYLPDESATKLLAWLWQRLAPGGRLLVGNFAPHNPSRAYMEWIGNWYLIYRTAEEMTALAQAAGIPRGTWEIGAERLGIDLFLRVDKPPISVACGVPRPAG